MRPLNRPMFRYGGPIKEGIMQGMKDGGSLSPQFNTGLVGDERYPKAGGREKHAFFLAPLVGQGLMAAGRMLAPRAIAAASKAFGRGLMTSPGKTGVFDKGLTGMQRLRNILPTGRFLQPATPTGQRITGKYVPAPLRFSEAIRSPEAIGKAIRENPIAAFAVAGQVKNAPEIGKGLFDVGKGTVQAATNYLLGTEFGKDKLPEGEEGSKLKRSTKEELEGADTTTNVTDDPNKRKQIDEDRIAKTKKRYYELMGIDKMKKDAAYDSLIDASKIVQQEGADLKGAIRSGNLQTQIINAISKSLDKSADIKRQIDAAILKGEIQKDIASADTTDKEYKKARTKQLKQATSATGQIAAIEAEKGTILGSQTAAILRASDIKYDDIIQDKLFNNFVKDNPGADEIDFMQAKGTGLDDGRYVIRGRLVEKKGDRVAFIV